MIYFIKLKYGIEINSQKNNKKWVNQDTDSLFEAILDLKNLDEAKMYFRDLLTESEILEFANRWKAAKMLSAGIIYTEIEKETGMSSTTVARIQNWLKNGMGGYKLMIKREKMNQKRSKQNNHHNQSFQEEIGCI